jgi:hypothetical protein
MKFVAPVWRRMCAEKVRMALPSHKLANRLAKPSTPNGSPVDARSLLGRH